MVRVTARRLRAAPVRSRRRGRLDVVEAVASDPRTIFVASASGGIFRSTNDGTTWDAVFERDGTALSVGDIAIAPSDPKIV